MFSLFSKSAYKRACAAPINPGLKVAIYYFEIGPIHEKKAITELVKALEQYPDLPHNYKKVLKNISHERYLANMRYDILKRELKNHNLHLD